jgi:hypothetical protein
MERERKREVEVIGRITNTEYLEEKRTARALSLAGSPPHAYSGRQPPSLTVIRRIDLHPRLLISIFDIH